MISKERLLQTVLGLISISARLLQLASGECDGSTTFYSSLQNGSIGFSVDGIPYGSCRWQISAPLGQRVLIFFTKLQLNSCGFSCSCDAVSFFDGWSDRRLAKYCGFVLPPPVYSRDRGILATYKHTTSWESFGEFQFNYSTLFKSQGCPSIDPTASAGVIYSPNFPWYFENNQSCEWFITVPYQKKINFNFTYFNPSSYIYCGSYVEMLDVVYRTEIFWMCQRYAAKSYSFTLSSSTRVRYISGSESSSAGFMAFYQIGYDFPSSTSTPAKTATQSGSCESYSTIDVYVPSYSSSRVNMGKEFLYVPTYSTCTVLMYTEEGLVLELSFTSMSVMSCSDCSCGHVTVRDGSNSDAPILGVFCNSHYRNPVSSSGNHMRIEYYSERHYDYFEATVRSKRSDTAPSVNVPAIVVPVATGVILLVIIAIIIKCVKIRRGGTSRQGNNMEYPLLIEPDDDEEMINLSAVAN